MKTTTALFLIILFILITNLTVNAEIKTPFKKLALTASGAETSKAAETNNDGTRHFANRHYSEGGEYFEKALKMDPNLAEAHFNLALVLHKKNRHKEATEHFKKAAELAPYDSRIQNSKILKHHVGGGHKIDDSSHHQMEHASKMGEHSEHKDHQVHKGHSKYEGHGKEKGHAHMGHGGHEGHGYMGHGHTEYGEHEGHWHMEHGEHMGHKH